MLHVLTTTDVDFTGQFQRLQRRGQEAGSSVESQVRAILGRVQREGDQALLELTAQFDGVALTAETLRVSRAELDAAYAQCEPEALAALRAAADNIRRFHLHQRQQPWMLDLGDGSRLGWRITPLQRVGMYVPGGKAAYPSTVLMCGIPAQVAGVPELCVCTPTSGRLINPLL